MKKTARCQVCGRELKSPESIAAGVGPICAARPKRARPSSRKPALPSQYPHSLTLVQAQPPRPRPAQGIQMLGRKGPQAGVLTERGWLAVSLQRMQTIVEAAQQAGLWNSDRLGDDKETGIYFHLENNHLDRLIPTGAAPLPWTVGPVYGGRR